MDMIIMYLHISDQKNVNAVILQKPLEGASDHNQDMAVSTI